MFLCHIRILWILASIVQLCTGLVGKPYSFTKSELSQYKKQVEELFYHGFDSYLKYGYPYDEVRPISCKPKTRKFDNDEDTITNDVLGNFTTTLVDSMTTIAVMGDKKRFVEAIELFNRAVPDSFEIDSTIQLFETTIRMLGGLLSAHLYATDPSTKVYIGETYDGSLLRKATDLADRLLVAYLSPTGLPVARLNLKYKTNINPDLMDENNAAATACPMFEFRLLSMLTLNDTYRQISEYAFNKTWDLRSDINLLPMSFNPLDASIYTDITGIGASVDSFYEYALKGAVLFDDPWLYEVWETSINAINGYSKADWFYTNVKASTGETLLPWIDSLSAFFPGLQVLDGRLKDASQKHLIFSKLWSTFGGIPERWNFQGLIPLQQEDGITAYTPIELEWYPLRPEFIESTYFLYRATNDVYYQSIGIRILKDFQTRFKFECGFAGLQDLNTGQVQDRMESFVLGETLKYLYLLFDEGNELHGRLWNHVFSTEAHPFWMTPALRGNYNLRRSTTVEEPYRFHLDILSKKKQQPRNRKILSKTCHHGDFDCNHCVNTHSDRHDNRFSTSEALCADTQIFEVDRIYARSLAQPSWIAGYTPFELTPSFYKNWVGPQNPSSAVPATSSKFEGIILDRDHDSVLLRQIQWNDHTTFYKYKSIKGVKITLENCTSGDIDSHGHRVDATVWEKIDFTDTIGNVCPDRSPLNIYKLTMIDGHQLNPDDVVLVDRDSLFHSNPKRKNRRRDAGSILSLNRNAQLLLECIPVINVYLV